MIRSRNRTNDDPKENIKKRIPGQSTGPGVVDTKQM